jgi:hypothetical protein
MKMKNLYCILLVAASTLALTSCGIFGKKNSKGSTLPNDGQVHGIAPGSKYVLPNLQVWFTYRRELSIWAQVTRILLMRLVQEIVLSLLMAFGWTLQKSPTTNIVSSFIGSAIQ